VLLFEGAVAESFWYVEEREVIEREMLERSIGGGVVPKPL